MVNQKIETNAPRDYIKSIGVALDKADNGSTAEKGYITEKIIKLVKWYEKTFNEKVLRECWDLF